MNYDTKAFTKYREEKIITFLGMINSEHDILFKNIIEQKTPFSDMEEVTNKGLFGYNTEFSRFFFKYKTQNFEG